MSVETYLEQGVLNWHDPGKIYMPLDQSKLLKEVIFPSVCGERFPAFDRWADTILLEPHTETGFIRNISLNNLCRSCDGTYSKAMYLKSLHNVWKICKGGHGYVT